MKKIVFNLCLLVAVSCTSQKDISQKDWIQLFNGKDMNDWTVKIRNHASGENFGNTFRVEDGLLKVRYDQYENFDDQFGHLFYKDKFSSYLLVIEYRFTGEQVNGGADWALRNSGTMLHGQSPQSMALDQDFPVSLEAQFLGGDGQHDRSTNNLCTPGTNVFMNDTLFTPHCINSTSPTFHGEQWVRAEVLVLGDSIMKHIVNGDTVMSYTKPQYDGKDKWTQQLGMKDGVTIKEGTISLQSESHPIDFRKVELFDLKKYADNQIELNNIINQLKRRSY
ncbi:MAG: DUF1080 domain-containing protein [Chitinophagaceae bacterium]|nr:DUF1080 domain-containing protein [Chitinophagaceae bacterium]